MNELDRKNIMNLADTIQGEINRMCVTHELSELDTMYQHATVNLKNLLYMRSKDFLKKKKDSWTPCSEPPQENGKYLCCDKDGDMNTDTFKDGEWFTEAYCILTTKWVAWRPLPEPWKGEKDV